MDTPALPKALKMAGLDYQKRLRLLGLDPEGLLWAFDTHDRQFHLWIVWSGTDTVGPYQIAKLLFKAYNLSALPQEVDPFVVQVLSPKQQIVSDLRRFWVEPRKNGVPVVMKLSELNNPDNEYTRFSQAWIYKFDKRDTPPKRALREWRNFQHNVNALAA